MRGFSDLYQNIPDVAEKLLKNAPGQTAGRSSVRHAGMKAGLHLARSCCHAGCYRAEEWKLHNGKGWVILLTGIGLNNKVAVSNCITVLP